MTSQATQPTTEAVATVVGLIAEVLNREALTALGLHFGLQEGNLGSAIGHFEQHTKSAMLFVRNTDQADRCLEELVELETAVQHLRQVVMVRRAYVEIAQTLVPALLAAATANEAEDIILKMRCVFERLLPRLDSTPTISLPRSVVIGSRVEMALLPLIPVLVR